MGNGGFTATHQYYQGGGEICAKVAWNNEASQTCTCGRRSSTGLGVPRPLGTRAFNRNDNRKEGQKALPRDPHFAMYLLQAIEKFVQIRANSCMTPLWRCRKRGWAAHIVHGSCRGRAEARRGGARQNSGATGRADSSKGNARKGGAGLGLRRVCAVRATPKTSRHVAQCRAERAGAPSGHLSARAPQYSKCAMGMGRYAAGEGRFG
jgi:hypothetical protein